MTETELHTTNRALVASFLFTDLVGFSKGTTADQYAAKSTLATILRDNLAALRDVDYRIKDTGDGALIAFVSNPEHALYMALAIAQDFGRAAGKAGFPSNSLRTGIHLGSVKEAIDFEARPNYVGDGINAAKRIMDFAAPGQITASRAFFEAVASLDAAYAALFSHVGAHDDKHGRAHELYAIAPSAAVLESLKRDLSATAQESAEFAARSQAAIRRDQESAAAIANGSASRAKAGGDVLRSRTMLVGAVIVLALTALYVGTKLNAPTGPQVPQVATEPSGSRLPPVATESVVQPTSHQAVAPPSVGEAGPVDARNAITALPSINTPPKPEVSDAVPIARIEGARDPTLPASALAAPATKTSATVKPRAAAISAASIPATAVPDRTSPRCSRIMEKATLGEALTIDEKRELANSCR
ncbi:MAG: adenylate/guanylate cyclase domain-containing protein [Betaproteobacteria bacterium]